MSDHTASRNGLHSSTPCLKNTTQNDKSFTIFHSEFPKAVKHVTDIQKAEVESKENAILWMNTRRLSFSHKIFK